MPAAAFTGHQLIASVGDLDAFVRRAASGERFTYCEAPDLIRSEASVRVSALADDGLVSPHRTRRAGGGFTFFVVRTGKPLPTAQSPQAKALADPATDLIFRAIKRAANFCQFCPTDTESAKLAGLGSRDQAQWRVRKLIDTGLIRSTVAVENGVPVRVVTVCASPHAGASAGKRTRLPPKWAALEAATKKGAVR